MDIERHGEASIPSIFPYCLASRQERCLYMDGAWWRVCVGCGMAWRWHGSECVTYKLANQRNHESRVAGEPLLR
jgi:hypothetical protein